MEGREDPIEFKCKRIKKKQNKEKKQNPEHFDWGSQGEKLQEKQITIVKNRASKRTKKNYLRDNSVILSKRPNRRKGLRPRCWTKAPRRSRNLQK